MKRAKNLDELRQAFAKTKSGCAGDTLFMARASMLSCEMLERIERDIHLLARKSRRNGHKLTPYQQFAREGMRAGKSMKVIGEEWREHKAAQGKA